MADFSTQQHAVTDVPSTVLVEIHGSIDAKTVPIFQEQLDRLRDQGHLRFILDLADIKYINSTGLGYLVNLADALEPQGGGVALIQVQPKVKVVFDMLGLNSFFKIYSNRESAIGYFATQGSPGAPKAAPPEPPAAPAPRARPAAPARPAAAPQPARPRPTPATASAPVVAQPPSPAPAAATETLDCSVCSVGLVVRDPGMYKCPRCASIFTYLQKGKTNFLPRRSVVPVQMTLTGIPECSESLRVLVRMLARKAGFALGVAKELGDSVHEVASGILSHAYGGNEQATYQVLVTHSETELTVKFSDYGKRLDGNGQLFPACRKTMDRFDVRPHPRGGNLISMSKRR